MARRTILLCTGLVLLLLGGASAVGGGAVMALFGSDNRLVSGTHAVSTGTSALVTSIDDVSDMHGTADVVGNPRLGVRTTAAMRPSFVGIGPAAAVDRYLAGAPIETAQDLDVDPFRLQTVRRDWTARPAPPGQQSFWIRQATGTDGAALDWALSNGDFRLVVMNADGSPGVSADAQFAVTVPKLFGIGVALLLGGLVILGVGLALIVLALLLARRTPKPGAGQAWPTQEPAPPVGVGGGPQGPART